MRYRQPTKRKRVLQAKPRFRVSHFNPTGIALTSFFNEYWIFNWFVLTSVLSDTYYKCIVQFHCTMYCCLVVQLSSYFISKYKNRGLYKTKIEEILSNIRHVENPSMIVLSLLLRRGQLTVTHG